MGYRSTRCWRSRLIRLPHHSHHHLESEVQVLYSIFVGEHPLILFRDKTNSHDNDFHSKSTDSILNYETVKYFTNESYEIRRFRDSVVKYQKYSSATQYSLSLLNITQSVILNATVLGTGLISAVSVLHGDLSIGSWVALQTWVNNIFVPLNFLGSVYGAIVQALTDIKNLSGNL